MTPEEAGAFAADVALDIVTVNEPCVCGTGHLCLAPVHRTRDSNGHDL